MKLEVLQNAENLAGQKLLNHNVSRKSIRTIMKKEKFHPYKNHLVQELNEDDFDGKVQFSEIIMARIQQDGNFINRIWFLTNLHFV